MRFRPESDQSMTVKEISDKLKLDVISCPSPDREVTNVYIGDLLSWVMGRAPADSAWITIMSNINICAVASLADTSCVILAEGVEPDPPTAEAAKDKGINLFRSEKTSYRLAAELSALGL